MDFEGIITAIGKEEEVWQNNLKKLTFVIEENSDKEYKNSFAVDLFWDKVELIKSYKVWDVVKLGMNFRAKEYKDRWFNSISAWKIDALNWWQKASVEKTDDDDLPF